MSIDLLILRNRVKLERMIREDKEYSIILKQSQKLDKLINAKMKEINASSTVVFILLLGSIVVSNLFSA